MGRATLVFALLVGACDSDDKAEHPTDAGPEPMDAPYTCMTLAPPARSPADACLALAPSALRGLTPLGNLDVALDYFGAGDCISHATATIGWTGACLEQVSLQFSYPVTVGGDGRRSVTTSYDVKGRFELRPPGIAPRDHVAMIHVEVVRWQENEGVHDIDITVTVLDANYTVEPIHIAGTFCDWPWYVCSRTRNRARGNLTSLPRYSDEPRSQAREPRESTR